MIACSANLPLSPEVCLEYSKKKKKKKEKRKSDGEITEITVSRTTDESFQRSARKRERIPLSRVPSIDFVCDVERSWSVTACRSVTGPMMLRASEINCEVGEESMIGAAKRARWSLRVLASRAAQEPLEHSGSGCVLREFLLKFTPGELDYNSTDDRAQSDRWYDEVRREEARNVLATRLQRERAASGNTGLP